MAAAGDIASGWSHSHDGQNYTRARRIDRGWPRKIRRCEARCDRSAAPYLLRRWGDRIDARFLDGLSEYDANTVSMLVSLDLVKGPDRIAWRYPSMAGRAHALA